MRVKIILWIWHHSNVKALLLLLLCFFCLFVLHISVEVHCTHNSTLNYSEIIRKGKQPFSVEIRIKCTLNYKLLLLNAL